MMMRNLCKSPKKSNPKLGRYAAASLAVFAFFCFVKVYQNVTVDNLNIKNGKLRQQLKELRDEYADLSVDVEELKYPDRINRYAEKEFDFVQAPKINLYVDK
jgi:cell division protein FtsL